VAAENSEKHSITTKYLTTKTTENAENDENRKIFQPEVTNA